MRTVLHAAATVLMACAIVAPAARAHGIQGRADLPVPIRAFYWAASIILVASFVGLALGWRTPLLRRCCSAALGAVTRRHGDAAAPACASCFGAAAAARARHGAVRIARPQRQLRADLGLRGVVDRHRRARSVRRRLRGAQSTPSPCSPACLACTSVKQRRCRPLPACGRPSPGCCCSRGWSSCIPPLPTFGCSACSCSSGSPSRCWRCVAGASSRRSIASSRLPRTRT